MDNKSITEKKRFCPCSYSNVVIGTLIGFGFLLVIPSLFFMKIFNFFLEKNLALKNGTEVFEAWKAPPVPIFISFNVFNYTNVDDILKNHSKPSVKQMGPYVYKEIRINKVIDYNENEVTYMQNNSFVFDRERSCKVCSEDDVIFTPSITSIVLMNKINEYIRQHSWVGQYLDWACESKLSLFRKSTIKELLWGYEDPVVDFAKKTIKFLSIVFGLKLPPMEFPPVALQLNSTEGMKDTGEITCLTGNNDIKDVQRIVRWKGDTNVRYWLSKYGNMINGTDGSRTAPSLSRDTQLYFFVPQLCRSLYARYLRDVKVEKINTYQFSSTTELFASAKDNPDNAAFCSEIFGKRRCWGKGLLPMSNCRMGVPIFVSAPHFYQAARELVEAINGMNPQEILHRTYMNIEPITGLVLDAHKRLQINIMAQKSYLKTTHPLRTEYNFLPVLFADESAKIDADSAKKIKTYVINTKYILKLSQILLTGVGTILFLVALTALILRERRTIDSKVETFKLRYMK